MNEIFTTDQLFIRSFSVRSESKQEHIFSVATERKFRHNSPNDNQTSFTNKYTFKHLIFTMFSILCYIVVLFFYGFLEKLTQ